MFFSDEGPTLETLDSGTREPPGQRVQLLPLPFANGGTRGKSCAPMRSSCYNNQVRIQRGRGGGRRVGVRQSPRFAHICQSSHSLYS